MIAVSIVTYRTSPTELKWALSCLKSSEVARIDVIDNASEPAIEWVCSEFGVSYIPNSNVGYGAAHNISLRRTLADPAIKYHLVLNSDVEFNPADLAKLEAFMDAHPDVGALQPRLVGAHGADLYAVRMLPTPADLFMRRFLPESWFPGRRDCYLLKHLARDEQHDIPYMQGSFMLLRADTLRVSGLFDERFFMYAEDIDMSRRVSAVSRAVYYPDVVVKHLHRAASYHSLRMLCIHCVNMIRYFNKWGWIADRERAEVNKSLAPRSENVEQFPVAGAEN